MDRPTPQQLLDDRNFILNLTNNQLPIIHADHPERRATTIEILQRLRDIPRCRCVTLGVHTTSIPVTIGARTS